MKTVLLALAAVSVATSGFTFGQEQPATEKHELRLLPSEFDFELASNGGTGTSGVAGIRTVVLKGDPNMPGLYTIMLKVPPHTKILAHDHPDDRVATVVSGTWMFGYGEDFNEQKLKALTPGSFYTEPAGVAHFAQTAESAVVLHITGIGPSGMQYIDISEADR